MYLDFFLFGDPAREFINHVFIIGQNITNNNRIFDQLAADFLICYQLLPCKTAKRPPFPRGARPPNQLLS